MKVFNAKLNKDGKTVSGICPHCSKIHTHSLGDGHRAAHCYDNSLESFDGYELKVA